MNQNLEQILEQDCTDFVKIEKINEYNKQSCLDFLQNLYENNTIDYHDKYYADFDNELFNDFFEKVLK